MVINLNPLASFVMVQKVHRLKMFIKKGYHVTEACVLTTSNHPVSIFSKIHSSTEKDYKSANTITFEAMEQGAALFEKSNFLYGSWL